MMYIGNVPEQPVKHCCLFSVHVLMMTDVCVYLSIESCGDVTLG